MIQIETKRLILRQPRKSDWKDLVEGAGEYDVAKMTTGMPHPYKKKDAVGWINKHVKNWGKKSCPFLIELKSEKKVIGCIDIHHIDRFSGVAMTGSWINKKYWRNGFITEAKIVANDFAFNKLKLRKLKSEISKGNIASILTQKKIGYRLEGVLRKEKRNKLTGKIHDQNLYGLLKEDWKKARTKLIKQFS